MPDRSDAADDHQSGQAGHPGAGWSFVGPVDDPPTIPTEPRTVRYPDPPVVWRRSFDPPVLPEWQALELGFGPRGVVDAQLILTFVDGSRLPQHLPKTGRNRFRALFRPIEPLAMVEIALVGSASLDAPLRLELRSVSSWERRRALLGRAFAVLSGDPRSFPWRLARFLVQVSRQGRHVIPPAAPAGSAEDDYRLWRERFDERSEDEDLLRERLSRLRGRPVFSVIGDPDITVVEAEALVQSLSAQTYDAWELLLPRELVPPHPGGTDARVQPVAIGRLGRADWLRRVLDRATGHIGMLPRPATTLRPHALATFAALADRWPAAELLYADDDDLIGGERADPRFKPAWSPTRLQASDYIGDLCGVAMPRLRRLSADALASPHQRLLRATAGLAPTAAVHIAQVLSHSGRSPRMLPIRRAHDIAPAPRVSLIVPTRDRADLLRLSVGSIRATTTYPNYEIIVVDNGSREAETLRLFEEWRRDGTIRILDDPSPFNYAGLNNRAVEAAQGTFVGLINNDIEVLDPAWLDEMVGWARQPGVGCVGAKLFYPDGRLQHGGVITGIAGAAGHRHKRKTCDASGMLNELSTVNEVSAVTAACLVVRKSIYREVGGLDEAAFAVAYNDVDFCLKVLRAGYRNLWTPFATLTHHESVSRGRDLSPKTAERFNRENLTLRLRWAERLLADPYYSPNLTLDTEAGTIRTQ